MPCQLFGLLFTIYYVLAVGFAVLQKPLAFVISKARAGKSQAAYNKIGGGSPINAYTKQQAVILEQKLKAQGLNANIYIAMRYWYLLFHGNENVSMLFRLDGVADCSPCLFVFVLAQAS